MVLNSPISGLPYREPLDEPALDVATQDLTTALDKVTVPTFASTAARNIAYAALIASGRQGMTCYVTNRQSLCYYGGPDGWQWVAQNNVLHYWANPGFQIGQASGAFTFITLHDTGVITLPPGQRLLQITAAGDLQGSTGIPGYGPTTLVLSGYGTSGNMWAPIPTAGQDGQSSVGRTWLVRTSGTVHYTLLFMHVSGPGFTDCWNTTLQILDFGACD